MYLLSDKMMQNALEFIKDYINLYQTFFTKVYPRGDSGPFSPRSGETIETLLLTVGINI